MHVDDENSKLFTIQWFAKPQIMFVIFIAEILAAQNGNF